MDNIILCILYFVKPFLDNDEITTDDDGGEASINL